MKQQNSLSLVGILPPYLQTY